MLFWCRARGIPPPPSPVENFRKFCLLSNKCIHVVRRIRMQLLHNEAVRVGDRGWRWRRAPFVQRGRAAAQGARTLGRAVPQFTTRGQHAASRGRGRRAPAARRPRSAVAVAHVHVTRVGRQPETGTVTAATPATAVADHHNHHGVHGHHHGSGHIGLVPTATFVVRVQQLNGRPSFPAVCRTRSIMQYTHIVYILIYIYIYTCKITYKI